MPRPVAEMKPLAPLLSPVLLAAALVASSGDAQRRPDQDAAYSGLRSGAIMPLREIEARYVGHMGGAAYLGPEFDPASGVYRLKFMRAGMVIWIDVDGRTGREIARSGH